MSMIEHTFALERDAEALQATVAALDPALLSGRDAARLTKAAARIERLGAAAKALLARRAEETGAWRGGRAMSVEQWLAETSGSSEGAAREALVTAQRLEHLPTTAERVREGTLSIAQAAQVSAGAAVDPTAEERLLRTAARSGMRGLRAEKERVVAAATDEGTAARLAHHERHLRTWNRGAATHGTFSGPTSVVADLLEALEPLTQRRFDAARTRAPSTTSRSMRTASTRSSTSVAPVLATPRRGRRATSQGSASTSRRCSEVTRNPARPARSRVSVPSRCPTPGRSSEGRAPPGRAAA